MPHGRSPGETHEEASPRAKTVVVVGAGLSGLSAAMHCAGAGYRVTLVEPLTYRAAATARSPKSACASTPDRWSSR